MQLSLAAQIESLLLYEGEALSVTTIAKTLEVSKEAVLTALQELQGLLQNRGIILIENGTTYMLATHPEMQPVFEKLRKDELERELSKSALETLTVIAYRGPITKHDIDYIRGVNSHFSLRNLMVRGLIEKQETGDMIRYTVTTDTLSYLGVTSTTELPDYEYIQTEYAKILTREENKPSEKSQA